MSIQHLIVATIVGLLFGFVGLYFAMSNILNPLPVPASHPSQQQAPIVIHPQTPSPAGMQAPKAP